MYRIRRIDAAVSSSSSTPLWHGAHRGRRGTALIKQDLFCFEKKFEETEEVGKMQARTLLAVSAGRCCCCFTLLYVHAGCRFCVTKETQSTEPESSNSLLTILGTCVQITSVFMLLAVCLNFWLAAYVIFLTLPFALAAFIGVGLAIYCGWRNGIWLFIGLRRSAAVLHSQLVLSSR